jgi:hypothetical protein
VNQITTNVISQKMNMRTTMAQNHAILDKGPIRPRPQHGQEPRRPGRRDD